MKILIRCLTNMGDLCLEEVEASEVKGFTDLGIHHERDRWIVTDIPTGLLVVSGHTKKEALENLYSKRHALENARCTELYKKRLKEFEEMKKL